MSNHIIRDSDGYAVGYISDGALAEYLDGLEIVTDGMYEKEQYTTEDARPNE